MKIRELWARQDALIGQEVTVEGWVKTARDAKHILFIALSDGTCFTPVQVVVDGSLEGFEELRKLGVASSVIVKGEVVASPGANQAIEIKATSVEVLQKAPSSYPLQKKRHSMEFLRTIAHLRPRTNTFQAVFRIRSLLAYAIHTFFQERGFVYVHTPIITSSDAEGAGEMFHVTTLDPTSSEAKSWEEDFFGKATNLTVSGQLEAEAYALAFRDVYTFGPTFRAENSNTARHAAEFWMIEPEMSFADLSVNMDVAEAMVKFIISYCLEHGREELEFFNKFIDKTLLERLEKIVASDFVRITYTEAIALLEKAKKSFEYPVSWGIDLQSEHERYLVEEVYGAPVFVTDYPKEIKAFYMRRNDDGKTVAAMDLLVPGVGELIGGSQREERPEVLEAIMEEAGMLGADYDWYMDLRRFGSVPHAGFGLGFERMVMYVTGISNIRDVIPFPRTVGNAEF